MSRKQFSPEFKTEAASKVLDEGLSIRVACETFGVGDTAMRRWVKQLAEERAGHVPQGNKPITPEQQRIRELEAQVRQLEEEKSILKKATAFFVQEQTGKRWFSK
jgi:transposase